MPSRRELEKTAASVPFWWHSIDLGGVTTKGVQSPQYLRRHLERLSLPDLRGKSVLDIGAYDGYYSFKAEQLGARRVVALDHFVWSLDLPAHIAYWDECKKSGVVPDRYEDTPHWCPDELPGKRGYDVAHAALGSGVETVVADFMTMDLAELGEFDVVLYLGVLYHMQNPFQALQRLASVTGGLAVVETEAMVLRRHRKVALCEFFESNELNYDVSNWWAPNQRALEGLCRASGFAHVESIRGPRPLVVRTGAVARAKIAAARHGGRGSKRLRSYRAIVHASKARPS